MIFQQTEKIKLYLDAPIDELKVQCEIICEDTDFHLNKYQISGIHHYSIDHKKGTIPLIPLRHLRAIIKKIPDKVEAEVELIHSYADLVGIGILSLALIILAFWRLNVGDDGANLSQIILFSLIIPLFFYLRLSKLNKEKTKLKQILIDIEKACEVGKEFRNN